MPIRDWGGAINQFSIVFEGRVPVWKRSFTQEI